MTKRKVCLYRGCDAPGIQRHLCRLHYGWWPYELYIHGEPIEAWQHTPNGYVEARVGGIWALEHRLILAKQLGRRLEHNEVVVHRDGDRTNNDPSNLWLTDRRGVAAYRKRLETECQTKNSTTGE
jgi:HNH endonuclease